MKSMLKRIVVGWLLLAVAVGLTAGLLPGVQVHGGVLALLWISALFAVVNLFLGSLLKLITAPVMILTLGLFGIVINGLMFRVTSWLTRHLTVSGFGTALLAGLLITVFDVILILTPLGRPVRRHRKRKAVATPAAAAR